MRDDLAEKKILPYRSTLTSSALLHLGKENPFSLLSTFATLASPTLLHFGKANKFALLSASATLASP